MSNISYFLSGYFLSLVTAALLQSLGIDVSPKQKIYAATVFLILVLLLK